MRAFWILFSALIGFCAMNPTPIFSEKLNVIVPSPENRVVVDGQQIGTGSVYKYELDPGSHHLQLYSGNEVVYQKIIDIPKGEATTIDASGYINRTPNSSVPNRGSAKLEADRLREAKGDFGVGFQITPVASGLSLLYFFDRIGVQALGWTSADYTAISPRLLWVISNKLFSTDKINTLYLGVGYGSSRQSNLTIPEERTMTQVFLGIEFPWGAGYTNLELGYASIQSNNTFNGSNGMNLSAGYHFYF